MPLLGALPSVVELFERQAASTPDRIALVAGDERLTYAALEAAVDRLAARLTAAGAGPGTLVGICAGKSAASVAAMLAVLRTGAAYLPLDPAHPAARIGLVLADSGARLQVTAGEPVTTTVPALRLEEEVPPQRLPAGTGDAEPPAAARVPTVPQDPASPAYVIYTSGSTGRPKGVMVSHRALANLLAGMRELVASTAEDVWLSAASLTFDMSVPEIYLPLVTGGRLVLLDPKAAILGKRLAALIEREGVTHMQATPSGWRVLLHAGFRNPRLTALIGGEALPAALARDLRPRVGRLVNMYGPTEAAVWATSWEVPHEPETISIGDPLPGATIHVVDDRLNPVSEGELAIGGVGVANGYLGRPALTAERFVPDPYGEPGGRLYLTGDIVRRTDAGLEFLRRADTQVKVRGHRVELGEVEAAMEELPGVRQAVAAVSRDALVAFVVGDCPGLRTRLTAVLPAYMVPTRVIPLDSLPLTPNGKIDRRALEEKA
ncbi:amino acid adenylation domain-containing protein [Nonomuraea sp. SYSU D8015]|uniref:amino acid adenylation domain-containing protein n=1 Tax=Nonomuraea sp. SYSU D8015 TaxID=2593644 RepID=UPI0016605F5A|nr:amino acid adenylation domain-containing protein [Nonomuraea sp. SYSU D8015]